jgi:hypothetical protein
MGRKRKQVRDLIAVLHTWEMFCDAGDAHQATAAAAAAPAADEQGANGDAEGGGQVQGGLHWSEAQVLEVLAGRFPWADAGKPVALSDLARKYHDALAEHERTLEELHMLQWEMRQTQVYYQYISQQVACALAYKDQECKLYADVIDVWELGRHVAEVGSSPGPGGGEGGGGPGEGGGGHSGPGGEGGGGSTGPGGGSTDDDVMRSAERSRR